MNKTKMTFRFDQQLPETSREDKLQVLPYKNESITNEQRETIRDKGLYQKAKLHQADNPQKGTERIRGMKKNTVTTQEAELNEPEDLNKRISSRRFAPTLRVQEGWDDPFGRSAASWSDADVLPDSLEEDEEAYHSVQEYRKRPPHPSRWKLVGSVASALVTGGMFGYIMLLLFNGGGMVPGSDPSVEEAVPVFKESVGVDAISAKENSVPVTVIEAQVPPQTYYLLQYGVFSTPERALQAKEELLKAGIAVGGDTEDQNRVYAGISPDREQAKLLSNQLKTQGVELYVRELELPGFEKAAYGGEGDKLTSFFQLSSSLVGKLSGLSSTLLGEGGPNTVPASDMKELNDLHQQWTQNITALPTGLPKEAVASATSLEKAMNSAISALGEYNKNTAKEHIWEIQSSMMEYVLREKEFIQFIKQ
ncbi:MULTISPECIES: SPOR domain-containing protein [Paenibacillus]|uniref:SPOR domain-containing protein n=1 Tax=Paenibacillus TaxID=44249 RepID=UPI0006C53F86|nr:MULTISPECIES: SPOR domain-containing protein [Paenibacillus]KAF6629715.1 SPOR domain-containing protein [Paenibacillus sp. EKM208P]KOS02662.1 sporulation protein [Paenibacillus polymyxa]PNQ78684.1 sporulation protein [Paenibacillus sp. F4]